MTKLRESTSRPERRAMDTEAAAEERAGEVMH